MPGDAPITAYFRLPRVGPDGHPTRWPVDDAAAGRQLVRQLLLGVHSGRSQLPAAVRQAGRAGLPLVVVHQDTVVAALRVSHFTAGRVELRADRALTLRLVGTRGRLKGQAEVQVWSAPPTAAPGPHPPPRLPPLRAPDTADYRAARAAMDEPPGI